MAKIKFGNIVVDMRGKVSGNVYAKNKGGAYCRVRVVPTNPKSADQSNVRANFTALSQAWRGLSEVERQSWRQGADSFKAKNNMGDMHTLSGNALFIALNRNLFDIGYPVMNVCPNPATISEVTNLAAVASTGAQTLSLSFDGPVSADIALKISASVSTSAGVNSIGSKMRKIADAQPADASPIVLTADYLAKFGVIGQAGDKIFIEVTPVSIVSGQLGAKNRLSIVIGA